MVLTVLMETVIVLLVCDGVYWWDVKSHGNNAQNTLYKDDFYDVLMEKANGL